MKEKTLLMYCWVEQRQNLGEDKPTKIYWVQRGPQITQYYSIREIADGIARVLSGTQYNQIRLYPAMRNPLNNMGGHKGKMISDEGSVLTATREGAVVRGPIGTIDGLVEISNHVIRLLKEKSPK